MTRIALKPGLFEPLDDPAKLHLNGGRCRDCGRLHFPSQTDCPYCGAAECERAPLSATGTVYLSTTVTSRPPGYDGNIPYGFGVIDLPEGIRIISRIIDPETAPAGSTVTLTLEPVGTDEEGREIVTYAFKKPPATSHQ